MNIDKILKGIKGTNWDGLTGNYSLDEIDPETVRKFIRMASRNGRLKTADENEDINTILKKLKLIINGKLTNAAIMLFGKNPQKYFINALVRAGRFKDEITIIGDRRIEGNLFKQIEEAEEAIKNFIPEPQVKEEFAGFSLYMRKDYYTEERLKEMGLNDRQIKAVMYVKENGRITNKEYQELNNIKKRQTSEDLAVLENKGILEKIGTTGKGTYYILKGH